MLTGRLPIAKRLSVFTGVALCKSSSATGSMAGIGVRSCFLSRLDKTWRICYYICYKEVRVGELCENFILGLGL